MRFRPGRAEDLDWCSRAVERDGGLPAGATRGLPAFWQRLIETNSLAGFALLENDESPAGDHRAGFAMSAFARSEFVQSLWDRPVPYFVSALLEHERHGNSALLTFDEVRAANSGAGLHLVVLHTVFRHRDLAHAETRRLIPVIGYAFFHAHAGYRLLSITAEYYGEQLRDFMQAGGYRVVDDFASEARLRDSAFRPVLVRRLREDASLAPHDPAALHLFHPESPRFFFTPAEQRVLLQAVLGASDRRIAAELDLSTETIRTVWDSVYTRVSRTSATLLSGASGEFGDVTSGARGTEKRRELLEYLRQHMEELRPVLRPR
jgi:DNA-binding CsgD family transcriptional regulator